MKVVLLAGGLGTRLAEETEVRPKPMVEVGGRPILWHILKHYAHFDFKEFFIALGYKSEVVKRWFVDYANLTGRLSVHLGEGRVQTHEPPPDDWTVHLIDTGAETQTGGRVKRLQRWLCEDSFLVTYGDGVADIDLRALVAFHKRHGRLATLTAVRPPARFGGVVFDGDLVAHFTEKPQAGEGWINGGFMVLEPEVFEYLEGDATVLEAHCLERLAVDGQLAAYRHTGFWQCMDTLRDKRYLDSLWEAGRPPWKLWK
jgi:glucose-1-phosphate cytidylyltransferase